MQGNIHFKFSGAARRCHRIAPPEFDPARAVVIVMTATAVLPPPMLLCSNRQIKAWKRDPDAAATLPDGLRGLRLQQLREGNSSR